MKIELIRCPECGQIQNATIQHGEIFDTYIHNCECGYTIMESEWDNNVSVFQASLIGKWFEMTKAKIKTENYREITPYWFAKLCIYDGKNKSRKFWETAQNLDPRKLSFKAFDINIMTWGYPKSTDTGRILKLEHKGIEIRTGNPEWGAEHGKEIKCQ